MSRTGHIGGLICQLIWYYCRYSGFHAMPKEACVTYSVRRYRPELSTPPAETNRARGVSPLIIHIGFVGTKLENQEQLFMILCILQRPRQKSHLLRQHQHRPKPVQPDPEKFKGLAYRFETWLPSTRKSYL